MKDTPTPKHTAGPWRVFYYIGGNGFNIGTDDLIVVDYPWAITEEDKANAELIARAPELLKQVAELTAENTRLKDERKKFASIIRNMHKPEYAVFIVDGEKIDGYEFADRLNEVRSTP